MLAVIHSIKDQFNPGGDAQFVEDTKQIFLHSVLAKSEFVGDVSVGESFGDECDDLLLARGQQTVSASIDDLQRRHLGDQIEQVVDLLSAGPSLAPMNNLNALAK